MDLWSSTDMSTEHERAGARAMTLMITHGLDGRMPAVLVRHGVVSACGRSGECLNISPNPAPRAQNLKCEAIPKSLFTYIYYTYMHNRARALWRTRTSLVS